jgi:hypothetical protein
MREIGSIIIYGLEGLCQIERDKFCRQLLGRTVKSHHGKYTHRVRGLLDNIPHIRVGRGIIIVDKPDKKRLVDFFRYYGIQDVFVRDIILTKTDIQELR